MGFSPNALPIGGATVPGEAHQLTQVPPRVMEPEGIDFGTPADEESVTSPVQEPQLPNTGQSSTPWYVGPGTPLEDFDRIMRDDRQEGALEEDPWK